MWETLCTRAAPGYDTPTNPCVLTPSGYPVLKELENTLVIPNLLLRNTILKFIKEKLRIKQNRGQL